MSVFIDQKPPENVKYIRQILWYFTSALIFETKWFPFSRIKVGMLKIFGCNIARNVYLKPCVRIKYPWKLKIAESSTIGEDVWIDNTEFVEVGAETCISQSVYICTGNHDYRSTSLPYFGNGIVIGNNCWLCARAVILPGAVIRDGCVVGIGVHVSGDIPQHSVVRLRQDKQISDRKFSTNCE
ncbi:hypothetical protein N9D58_03375 [Planktomarina temperata]|nr:hypothetical protein [Planktomarina temperata]